MNARPDPIAEVLDADGPAALFGPVVADAAGRAAEARRFRRLAAAVHPDVVAAADRERAARAFSRLTAFDRRWRERSRVAAEAATGRRGDGVRDVPPAASSPRLVGRRGAYRLAGPFAAGSIADVHRATDDADRPVVVKIARSERAGALLEGERRALADLASAAASDAPWLAAYVPRLVDRLTVEDPTGERRAAHVLDDLTDGFVTLADVASAYPDGLDHRDWAWMHRRLLRVLAATHRAGWVHTAIGPENVLVHPERHGIVLVGWSFATPDGAEPLATAGAHGPLLPPESGRSAPATGAWDVFMVHALARRLLGPAMPAAVRAFTDGCMQRDPRSRPDAVDLLDEYDDLLERLYGPRRFRPFTMPATRGA